MHTLLIKYPCGKTEKRSVNADYSTNRVAYDAGDLTRMLAESKYTGEFTCKVLC